LYTNDLAMGTSSSAALMIVPFPNPSHADEFGLVDVQHTLGFRSAVSAAFKQYETRDVMLQNATLSASSFGATRDKAEIIQVGNYKCSVVPNLDALLRTVQWDRFSVPADLHERLSVLNDPCIVPADCGFVVAEATRSIRDDGFGIVFPGRHAFLPTCHEGGKALHDFDVCCYAANAILPSDIASVVLPYNARMTADNKGLDGVFAKFPTRMRSSIDGRDKGLTVDTAVTHFAFSHIKGWKANRNVRGLAMALPRDELVPPPPVMTTTATPSMRFSFLPFPPPTPAPQPTRASAFTFGTAAPAGPPSHSAAAAAATATATATPPHSPSPWYRPLFTSGLAGPAGPAGAPGSALADPLDAFTSVFSSAPPPSYPLRMPFESAAHRSVSSAPLSSSASSAPFVTSQHGSDSSNSQMISAAKQFGTRFECIKDRYALTAGLVNVNCDCCRRLITMEPAIAYKELDICMTCMGSSSVGQDIATLFQS
jgi:hypothetical protein